MTEELWTLPPDAVAVLRHISVSPISTEVYRVGPGARVLVFADGRQVAPSSVGPDHFVVKPQQERADHGTVSTIHAAALGRQLCSRYGREPIGVDVVIVASSPLGVALEVRDVRGRDELPMCVSAVIAAEFSDLGAFVRFMGSREVLSTGELEQALLDVAGPAFCARLSRWTAAELELPESRHRLAKELAEDVAGDLAAFGLRVVGLRRLMMSSSSMEEIRAKHAAIREFQLETQAVSSTIDAKGKRDDVLLGGKEAATARSERNEADDARRQRLAQAIRARITDDRIHEYMDADRFAALVREEEHKLQLTGLIRDDELDSLRRKLANGARMAQLLQDIELREFVRATEKDEATHVAEIEGIAHDAAIGRKEKSKAAKRKHLKGLQRIKHEDDKHRFRLEAMRLKQEHDFKLALERARESMTPAQRIAITCSDPAVLIKLLDAEGSAGDRTRVFEAELARLREQNREIERHAFERAIDLAREAMQRMAEAAAASKQTNNYYGRPGDGRRSDG